MLKPDTTKHHMLTTDQHCTDNNVIYSVNHFPKSVQLLQHMLSINIAFALLITNEEKSPNRKIIPIKKRKAYCYIE